MLTTEEERIQVEIDRAWKEKFEHGLEEQEKQFEEELCPCGHKHREHYGDHGECLAQHCGCPEFGEPVENWEAFTEVNAGGNPGGFRIYE